MRFLHTSDWHLGATSCGASRGEDHAHFLAWLLAEVERREIDVLLVSGDVFDTAQPSAEALRRYYGFLVSAAPTCLRKVVIVGGNHDSPSRLDAPSEVLAQLEVHVVGGLGSDPTTWGRCLCPVSGPDGVEAVVLAVPYVHEFRLGIRTTGDDSSTIRARFREAFTRLYRELADTARARWPGVPLIGMGHLTCSGTQRLDYPIEVHQAVTFGGLPGEIFDPRLQYIALGHIHRAYGVQNTRAWYSGSPIPFDLHEAASTRHVLQVTLAEASDAEASVEPVPVPEFRNLIEVRGTPTEAAEQITALTWETPLPPLVFVELSVSTYHPDAEARIYSARDTHGADCRPKIVRIRQHASLPPDVPLEPREFDKSLSELEPIDVFVRLCTVRGEPVDESLLRAFRTVTALGELSPEEALDAELHSTEEPGLLFSPRQRAVTSWESGDSAFDLCREALESCSELEVIYATQDGARLTLRVRPERLARRGAEAVVVAIDAVTQIPMTLVAPRIVKARLLEQR